MQRHVILIYILGYTPLYILRSALLNIPFDGMAWHGMAWHGMLRAVCIRRRQVSIDKQHYCPFGVKLTSDSLRGKLSRDNTT